jgi:4-hydroxy-tetrahydrodipicolinate reductase
MIRVILSGATGKVGQALLPAIDADPELELAALAAPSLGTSLGEALSSGGDVVVDFSVPAFAAEACRTAIAAGLPIVLGTTGIAEDELGALGADAASRGLQLFHAANFAIGAALMMRFAELAAPFFETAEIMELHHDRKVDAPSGTAALTARRMSAASKDWADDPTTTVIAEGARGGLIDGIPVHSLRMRGMVAHQEVLLGTTGQTLSIRHDSYDRDSFMPGVLLAVRKIAEMPGLTIGLDAVLGL